MKKRLILGDIHGHSSWERIYDYEKPDIVVIVGDYVDSFSISSNDMKTNLLKLLYTKKEHERIHGEHTFIMLLGNHDFHYCNVGERYSGYSKLTYNLVGDILYENSVTSNTIDIVYFDEINNIIFSHAGISNTWWNMVCKENKGFSSINDINELNWQYLSFTSYGGGDFYGSSLYNGPLWIRPYTLKNDLLNIDNILFTQIVGHTHTSKIKQYAFDENNECKLYTIDSLPNEYIIENLSNDDKLIDRNIKSVNESLMSI